VPKKNRQEIKVPSIGKPNNKPEQPHVAGDPLQPTVAGRWIWVPLKGEWRVLTPEEKVRQHYVLRLRSEYAYELEQMDQERRVRHGRQSPKADIIVWESAPAKQEGRSPVLVG
jgi:type I restriction enzyme M protein